MRLACLTALLFAALVGPAAAGQVVVGKSVRGVALGEDKRAVVQRLGRPMAQQVRRTPLGRSRVLGYERLTATLLEGVVVAVRTTALRDRTRGGIGVGSRRRAVRREIDRVRCTDGRCRVGRRQRGRALTEFGLRGGRVAYVLVARVLRRPRG